MVTPPGERVDVDVDLLDELVEGLDVFSFLVSTKRVVHFHLFNLEEGFSHVVVFGVLKLLLCDVKHVLPSERRLSERNRPTYDRGIRIR